MSPWIALGVAVTLVFVGVPTLFLALAPWTWSELDGEARRRVFRSLLSAGALFALVGAALGALLAAISHHWLVTFVGVVTLTGALSVWSVRSAAPVAMIRKLGDDLEKPALRDAARARLLELTAKLPDDVYGSSVRLSVATVLSNAGLESDALTMAEKLSEEGFDEHQRELRQMILFSARVATRQIEAAHATLAALPELAPDNRHSASMRTIHGRLLVIEGKPDEAIALLREPCEHPLSERGRRAVLAHAYAAREDNAELEATLDWLESQPRGLESVVTPEGPASASAMARLASKRGPYRR